jgi:hypothetical protein
MKHRQTGGSTSHSLAIMIWLRREALVFGLDGTIFSLLEIWLLTKGKIICFYNFLNLFTMFYSQFCLYAPRYNTEAADDAQHKSVLLIDPCGHCQDAAKFFSEDVIAGRTALGLMQAYETFGARPVKRNNVKNVTFYVM